MGKVNLSMAQLLSYNGNNTGIRLLFDIECDLLLNTVVSYYAVHLNSPVLVSSPSK